jgi:xylulokinase
VPATLILAHDLGTTGDKASLHDGSGHIIAATTEAYGTDFGPRGKAEQDPVTWWDAFAHATRKLLSTSGRDAGEIACVSFSGQMQGAVLVDDAGVPVRPAIIWADTRAQVESRLLIERVGLDRAYEVTGHRLSPTYTLAKACWVREHEPEAWGRVRSILQAKDYLVLRLTGRRVTDRSDASGTNAFDQQAQAWSRELIAAAELDWSLFPEIVPSATVAGGVTRAASEATGLREGTPVVVGGGDGACAALGAGIVSRESGANAYLGSSAWISIASDRPLRDSRMRTMTFDHVVPGRFVPIGTMQAGGASLDWLLATFGAKGHGELSALLDAAANAEAATDGLFFLPYLLGERSPHWNPLARGAFVGLAKHHGTPNLTRAVLEGVAFNLRTILLALEEIAGPIPLIDAIGGGARSDEWLRILADSWGVPIRRRSLVDEANALGAAVVGGVAVGLLDGWEIAGQLSTIEATFEPRRDWHERYAELYPAFCDAYDRLEPWFGAGGARDDAAPRG